MEAAWYENGEVEVEVEEVGEEALLIKGSSALMSSWSEEDDEEEELSWFAAPYRSMAAIFANQERDEKRNRNPLCRNRTKTKR